VGNGAILEAQIERYLFGQSNLKNKPVLRVLCDALLDDIMEAVRQYRCPFCNREFSSIAGLKAHLHRTGWKSKGVIHMTTYKAITRFLYPTNPCAYKYAEAIDWLINVYRNFKTRISQVEKRHRYKVRLELPGQPIMIANGINELCDWLGRHKSIIHEYVRKVD